MIRVSTIEVIPYEDVLETLNLSKKKGSDLISLPDNMFGRLYANGNKKMG